MESYTNEPVRTTEIRTQESQPEPSSSGGSVGRQVDHPKEVGARTANPERLSADGNLGNNYQDRSSKLSLATRDGAPVVDSHIIADRCGVQHESVIRLAREYQEEIEADFGRVRFEIGTLQTAGGIQKTASAQFTEDQATVLITFVKNTLQVRAFKIALVKAFAEAKRQIAEGTKLKQSLPDLAPFFAVMKKLQQKGISPDMAAQVGNDMLKAQAVQARYEDRTKPKSADWRNEPPTDKQREKLEALGLNVPETKGEAWDMIRRATKRSPGRPKGSGYGLKILAIIRQGVTEGGEIVAQFMGGTGLRKSTGYRILAELVEAGEVTRTQQGCSNVYRLAQEGVARTYLR